MSSSGRRLRRLAARISVRLLAFNLLLVFVPVAAVLVLDTYERQLLRAQERAMVEQGRVLAAALAGKDDLDPATALAVLTRLERRSEARLRVYDATGKLVADSAWLGPRRETETEIEAEARSTRLYRVASAPIRAYRHLVGADAPLEVDPNDPERARRAALRVALQGSYGATTAVTGSDPPLVVLHSAIPIPASQSVAGAVVVSQSTERVLAALDAVRLDVARVFGASVGLAVLLTLVVATTIVRPLTRLRNRASAIVDRRGRPTGRFPGDERHDEIGDLARALNELTLRLEDRMRFTESFASDVAHELRNPLASIRTAAETAIDLDDRRQRERFLTLVLRDVARVEHLITAVREASRIDGLLEEEERKPVVLNRLLPAVAEGARLRAGDAVDIVVAVPDQPATVEASPDRLAEALENLLSNAQSFSPPGGTIRLNLEVLAEHALITVEDEGPGIPPPQLEKIFERFYSDRPERGGHTGLGLSLVRSIVNAYGGTVIAGNRPEGGARFRIHLPLAG